MAKKRLNCWEYHGCGREPDGKNIKGSGVCPAAADTTFDGINSGRCAGRFCWAVAGTFCEGKQQGSYVDKQPSCQACDFFRMVLAEEGTLNLRTKFLRFIPPYTRHALLTGLELKEVKKSHRFIRQGDSSGDAYIIRRGSCLLLVEKEGTLHPADHRGEGDILNMAALFTGEPASFHVEAETDMELWVLKRRLFEKIPEKDPDLFNFLTEIVADRFDSGRPISERTIGRYTATDIIGRGGYSIVYKGIESTTGQSVAIKMLRHNMVKDADFLESFRNEARIVAGLDHENIIDVYEIKERFRTAFIMMEYLEGESVAAKLRKEKRIAPEDAVSYLTQAGRAIDYAYKKGVLHKDISPENLMVTKDRRIKLVDFGLASFIHDDDGMLDGAFSYLAPEICSGAPAGIQSEIYALGITAFEMVTGHRPYPESDPAEFMRLRREVQIPDPGKTIPGLPASLRRFIIKACRLSPDERYQDMAEAVEDLSRAEGELAPHGRPVNCWEFMNCGRNPDDAEGRNCDSCPATRSSSLDGLNEGKKAGRACWLVAGTFCSNRISGSFAEKIDSCMECEFYRHVNRDSGQTRLRIENIDIFGLTDIGLRKEVNEDRYLVRQMEDKSLLLAVADGLGGDVSSDFAAEIVKGTLVGLQRLIVGNELSQMRHLVLELDKRISEKAQTQPELDGMATTLVCAILKKDFFHWINVGDSRLYLFRDKELLQLSEDQTLAKFLIEEGELLPEEAKEHYSYDILDQCIGYGECAPQTGAFKVKKNDLLILSTDGLHKMVPRETVAAILGTDTSIEERVKKLAGAALDSGGKDNITIVIARINQTLK
ncbi:MAG: protein kinase [Desulfobacterales bacterium]|nr:protein kinase [Desulfobacterales bacterium]